MNKAAITEAGSCSDTLILAIRPEKRFVSFILYLNSTALMLLSPAWEGWVSLAC